MPIRLSLRQYITREYKVPKLRSTFLKNHLRTLMGFNLPAVGFSWVLVARWVQFSFQEFHVFERSGWVLILYR